MFADKDTSHIAGLVPFGFAGHVIADFLTVDHKIFECYVGYFATVVVARDYRELAVAAVICDVFEENAGYRLARGRTIFLVEENADVDQLPLTEVFNAYVVESDVAHYIVVAAAYTEATLIVELLFLLVEDVDVAVYDICYCIRGGVRPDFCCRAMKTDHDRMGHIGPKSRVFHRDIAATAYEALAGGIDG